MSKSIEEWMLSLGFTRAKGSAYLWEKAGLSYIGDDQALFFYNICQKAEAIGYLQGVANVAKEIEYELTLKDLSPDNLPEGYRKMTDKEIIVKVAFKHSQDKMSQLTPPQTTNQEKEEQ